MEFSKYADVNPKCGKVPNSFYYIDLECVNAGEIKDLRIEMAETAPSRAQRVLTLYDILFQTVRPYQKNNYHFKAENDLPTVASTGYAVFRTEQSSEYLYELIHTERFLSDIMKRCTGTSFPAVSSSDIEDIAIWIPEFQEQKKIGYFLTLVDTKIAKQRLLIEHLKKYKRGVLKTFFNDFLSTEKCIPMSYIVDEMLDGDWIESKDQSKFGIRLIQTGNVGCGEYIDKPNAAKYISENTFRKLNCSEIFSGDILISRLPSPAGRACIIPSTGERMITAVDCTIVRCNETVCCNRYLLQFLNSPQYFKIVESFLAGGTRQRISRKNLESICVPLPPLEKQRWFADMLGVIDQKIQKELSVLELLMQCKCGILQKVFV